MGRRDSDKLTVKKGGNEERIRKLEEENQRLRAQLAAYQQRDKSSEDENSPELGGETKEQAGTSEPLENKPQTDCSGSLELGPQAGHSDHFELVRPYKQADISGAIILSSQTYDLSAIKDELTSVEKVENTEMELMKYPDQKNPSDVCIPERDLMKFQEILEKFCNDIISHCKRRFQSLDFSEIDGSLAFFLSHYLQIESDVLRFQMRTAMEKLNKQDLGLENAIRPQNLFPLKHKDQSIVDEYSEKLKNINDFVGDEFNKTGQDGQNHENGRLVEEFTLRNLKLELLMLEANSSVSVQVSDNRPWKSVDWCLRELFQQEELLIAEIEQARKKYLECEPKICAIKQFLAKKHGEILEKQEQDVKNSYKELHPILEEIQRKRENISKDDKFDASFKHLIASLESSEYSVSEVVEKKEHLILLSNKVCRKLNGIKLQLDCVIGLVPKAIKLEIFQNLLGALGDLQDTLAGILKNFKQENNESVLVEGMIKWAANTGTVISFLTETILNLPGYRIEEEQLGPIDGLLNRSIDVYSPELFFNFVRVIGKTEETIDYKEEIEDHQRNLGILIDEIRSMTEYK
ncbi:Protein CBG21824 [Caenorhabditis briggsae]|uniref:Protein CBG21824 n=1 Tax=Caenorhabditis briggsae TaxID=6238 RepID=A8Y0W7_CAEBR|nr:Protein CBG21824 [Caenorhabditis briggsae]CAP38537.1 Protein CBG21824 [Caenorhabditis briggsae]